MLSLPRAAGSLDVLENFGTAIVGVGWMLFPGVTLADTAVHIDGLRADGVLREMYRPDLVEQFAWSEGVTPVAFSFLAPIPATGASRIDLVAGSAGGPHCRLSSLIPHEPSGTAYNPPRHLSVRVSGVAGSVVRQQGLRMLTDLGDLLSRHGLRFGGRVLDWGCGCGRVAHQLRDRHPDVEIAGCDIDAEAIAWCQQNLVGQFDRVDTAPPAPYADATFDYVIGCSVLTHLDAPHQARWLSELRRILKPGGHLLASVAGQTAYAFVLKAKCGWSAVSPDAPGLDGIIDQYLDPTLDGIAPARYYRAVYQSRSYTVAAVSEWFEVLDYVERGLNGHQDLLLLRAKP